MTALVYCNTMVDMVLPVVVTVVFKVSNGSKEEVVVVVG